MRSSVLAFAVCFLLVACGPNQDVPDSGTEVADAGCQLDGGDSFSKGDFLDAGTSVEFEQQCGKVPDPLRTGLAVGGFCTVANACVQHRCDCANVSKSYGARGCSEGVCQDKPTSCAWAASYEPRLCQ